MAHTPLELLQGTLLLLSSFGWYSDLGFILAGSQPEVAQAKDDVVEFKIWENYQKEAEDLPNQAFNSNSSNSASLLFSPLRATSWPSNTNLWFLVLLVKLLNHNLGAAPSPTVKINQRSDVKNMVEYLIKLLDLEAFWESTMTTGWLDSLISNKLTAKRPDAMLAGASPSGFWTKARSLPTMSSRTSLALTSSTKTLIFVCSPSLLSHNLDPQSERRVDYCAREQPGTIAALSCDDQYTEKLVKIYTLQQAVAVKNSLSGCHETEVIADQPSRYEVIKKLSGFSVDICVLPLWKQHKDDLDKVFSQCLATLSSRAKLIFAIVDYINISNLIVSDLEVLKGLAVLKVNVFLQRMASSDRNHREKLGVWALLRWPDAATW
ncbi:hypothetical protein BKA70DRAFT_1220659 [Coprinopsis sp. MPI-PUGE-AT-0042]|nr:hypothetical protein BKA70DRAFT_1220659 [Coprinopsis sp. MPI-PUGE-AT-0042]